jgi:hypothetical protein
MARVMRRLARKRQLATPNHPTEKKANVAPREYVSLIFSEKAANESRRNPKSQTVDVSRSCLQKSTKTFGW